MVQAHETMRRIGLELIEEKRRAALAEGTGKGKGDATEVGARDILSILSEPCFSCALLSGSRQRVLVRSNLASTPHQRMSVTEILSQISTFLAAGHETTASALTWCLYALVRDEPAQARLRAALREIEAVATVIADGEAQAALTERIGKCEYLDWVVRESLRVHAPVTNTMRVCMRDEDVIPVSREDYGGVPGAGGYVDKHGQRRWGIRVKKWDIISVPIQAINKSTALWGKDAHLFRWALCSSRPQSISSILSDLPTSVVLPSAQL